MTPRRLAALAQALAIAAILVPGPGPGGHATASAAADSGLGCSSGVGRFKGPRVPRDPPPPPGATPTQTPSPAPSEAPFESPSPAPDAPAQDASAADASDAAAKGPIILQASVRVAQADPTATLDPDATPESTPRPRKTRQVEGIDVSHHNGDIDYDLVRTAGQLFAFFKATQDTTFRDPMFALNMARARAAGVIPGAYHFFDYTLDGKAQADHFLDRVESAGGLLGALPPVVDVECWRPSGVSTHVTSAARLRDFIGRVYERTGRLPIIYTSVFMWDQVMGDSEGFGDLPLWAACWSCDAPPILATGWDDWSFWQTGLSRIKNVGRVDGNVFNGTSADLAELRLRPFSLEGGARLTGQKLVDLDLGGREAESLRTSHDGVAWSAWRPVRGGARAELAAVDGEQTLYVQLRAGRGLTSPVLSDTISLDVSGPELTDLAVVLAAGPVTTGTGVEPDDDGVADVSAAGVPVAVTWMAVDQLAGLTDASVSVTCGDSDLWRTEAPGSAEPAVPSPGSAVGTMPVVGTCDALVIARDGVGNATRGRSDSLTTELLSDAPSTDVVYTGEWHPFDGDGPGATPLGGVAQATDSRDASVTATVTADQVGVVALRGPEGGRAAVRLDGEEVGMVDLYAPESSGPELVLVIHLAPDAPHTLTLQPVGPGDPASGGGEVVIDGFVTLTTG